MNENKVKGQFYLAVSKVFKHIKNISDSPAGLTHSRICPAFILNLITIAGSHKLPMFHYHDSDKKEIELMNEAGEKLKQVLICIAMERLPLNDNLWML